MIRSSMTSNSVLFLSHSGESCSHLRDTLRGAGVPLCTANSVPHAKEELLTRKYTILVDRCDSVSQVLFELLEFIGKHHLPTRLIVSSRTGGVEDAVRLMKAGAHDFLVGKVPDKELPNSVLRGLALHERSLPSSDKEYASHQSAQEIVLVGQSPAISEIHSAINLVAKTPTNVLITGESGTGKEIVARLLHMQSNRAEKAFVAVNCAALPKEIMENELFGHQKGAFTGALTKKAGYFEMADGGTLFLDEIGEMTSETQAKLLRAIEHQTFRRLGGEEEVSVNVRTIAATNKNISAVLESGKLREDLYYRLSVIEIFLPPLRERREDIALLVEHFLSVFSEKYSKPQQRFSRECMDMFIAFDWPGNVRELQNVIERSVVICPDEIVDVGFLPQKISMEEPVRGHIQIPVGTSRQEAERILILETLASVKNNKSKAAKILGLSRKTLHNKLLSFTQLQE